MKLNLQEQRGRFTPPSDAENVEKVDGDIVAPNFRTYKPKREILPSELSDRRKQPPEMQYALTKQRYKDNTNQDAFITSGEVSELIASVCFYRRPDNPGQWLTAPRFVSPYELQGAVDAYFEIMYDASVHGSELIPDSEHLYLFLGVSKSTVRKWKKEQPEYGDIIDNAMTRILTIKKQLAMHNKIPQLVYMNDIQNNHGYKQKDQPEEQADDGRVIPNVQELIEAAKHLPG